jgi:hypothetical protein
MSCFSSKINDEKIVVCCCYVFLFCLLLFVFIYFAWYSNYSSRHCCVLAIVTRNFASRWASRMKKEQIDTIWISCLPAWFVKADDSTNNSRRWKTMMTTSKFLFSSLHVKSIFVYRSMQTNSEAYIVVSVRAHEHVASLSSINNEQTWLLFEIDVSVVYACWQR